MSVKFFFRLFFLFSQKKVSFLVTFMKLVEFIGRKRAEWLSLFYRTTIIEECCVECLELVLMP